LDQSVARQWGSQVDAMGVAPSVDASPEDQMRAMVDTDEVVKRKGVLPILSRYVTDRSLASVFDVGTILGTGVTGPVRLLTKKDTGAKYAVKTFLKGSIKPSRRAELSTEVQIFLAMDHPHVARLEHVFEDAEELHLVMELMEGGELYERLSQRRQYTEEDAAGAAKQMLTAVAYIHSHHVVHRDLKLENFLYESKGSEHLKLIDFGFAKVWHGQTMLSKACGSLHYVAPEVLGRAYGEKADLWSLGVIVYMLLLGSPPFHGPDEKVVARIREGTPMWSSRFPKLSRGAQDFVKLHLQRNPELRPSAQESLDHPWVKGDDQPKNLIDDDILKSLRLYSRASHFKRACLSMMAWSLSRDERMELRDAFQALDTDNSGTITFRELKYILEDQMDLDADEAKALFDCMDTDCDAEVAYSEFLAAALEGRIHLHEELLHSTFSRFDADHTGVITAENLKTMLGDSFEGCDMKELLSEGDINADGSISYEEFLACLLADEVETTPRSKRSRATTEILGDVIDKILEDEQGPQTGRRMSTKSNRTRTSMRMSARVADRQE